VHNWPLVDVEGLRDEGRHYCKLLMLFYCSEALANRVGKHTNSCAVVLKLRFWLPLW